MAEFSFFEIESLMVQLLMENVRFKKNEERKENKNTIEEKEREQGAIRRIRKCTQGK